jgi:hypothetical protein
MANSHWQAAGSPFKQHELITISRYVAILHMNGIYSNMANGQQHYFDALAGISNRLRFVQIENTRPVYKSPFDIC